MVAGGGFCLPLAGAVMISGCVYRQLSRQVPSVAVFGGASKRTGDTTPQDRVGYQ